MSSTKGYGRMWTGRMRMRRMRMRRMWTGRRRMWTRSLKMRRRRRKEEASIVGEVNPNPHNPKPFTTSIDY